MSPYFHILVEYLSVWTVGCVIDKTKALINTCKVTSVAVIRMHLNSYETYL